MSVEDGPTGRGRRRSHHACLNCRRKKTRCPGERPACSSCSRLGQQCSYAPAARPAQGARSEERLAHLEEKLDLLLNGSVANRFNSHQCSQHEHAIESSDKSQSPSSSNADQNHSSLNLNHHHSSSTAAAALFDSDNDSSLRPSQPDVAVGVGLYFKYCHRQPIWCFEREEVADVASIPEELACSILALTCRFHEKRGSLQLYRESAKTLVMLRIANGTVELTTIESLCLLSYSSFIDGNFQLGQFHLGLAFQLCRTAMLDVESMYMDRNPGNERKKKLFWSLQLLEQFYGKQEGLLSVPTDIWRPHYSSPGNARPESRPRGPPLPHDDLGCSDPSEPGIWNTSVHLAWVWSQVRKYVSNCSQQVLTEPWRHDSMYAQVLSDFMETENRIPICHRYDSAKFYRRKVTELKNNRDYWAPWLKEQFTYHAIHTVLNHPFLYIVGAQHNPNLAIPNTFWRRSSELALLHATWIVRMIDMVVDKQVPLADPFFGHIAAVAATVHLYYCCATAPRLKHKSNTDFNKCRRFLKRFIPSSTACELLDQTLDRMTRMAAGPEIMDVDDWMPSKIYLNVPLMWDILLFNSMEDPMNNSVTGLLDTSLTPSIATQNMADNSSTLEIVVATSPEISINTADGGQEAPTLSFKSAGPLGSPWSNNNTNHNTNGNGNGNHQNNHLRDEETLTFNFTPWLYADSTQFLNSGDFGYANDAQSSNNGEDNRGGAWWEGDNMNGVMFNSF